MSPSNSQKLITVVIACPSHAIRCSNQAPSLSLSNAAPNALFMCQFSPVFDNYEDDSIDS